MRKARGSGIAGDARDWRNYIVTFAICFVILFLSADRTLNIFDESISLTAGYRVMAGQIPYRDFYFIYGPALPYILAALFRVFGLTVFVAFVFDLVVKGLVCASFFAIARRYCSRWIAVFFTGLLVLWHFTLQLNLQATVPVSLLFLWTLSLVLPGFSSGLSRRRCFGIGILAGITALFRHDCGIALLFVTVCLILAAAALHARSAAPTQPRSIASAASAAAGFAIVVGPALLIYLAVGPWHDLYFDLYYYLAHYYRSGRGLPLLHRADLGIIGELTLLVPGCTVALAAIVVVHRWPRRVREGTVAPAASLIGVLSAFGLLAAVMYVKSLVRIDMWQNYLALVPTLLLLAILFQHRNDNGPLVRGAVYAVTLFCVFGSLCFAKHTMRVDLDRKSLVIARLVRPQTQAPLPPESNWCELRTPATRHLCFLVDSDHIHTIEFLRANTRPDETVYVGLRHHDRIFANDNVIYFAAQLLPAVHWSQLDPYLENSLPIQQQMIEELKSSRPMYIVLDSEFEAFNEPNGSSLSSGVTLLDDFIGQQYAPVRHFGELTVLERRPQS